MRSSAPSIFALAIVVCGASACGRRATHADCELIVDRSVELKMKVLNKSDPAAIAAREAQIRSELEPSIKSCEGRRVTDQTMACVRGAKSSEELERCLD
jgi:hypothetical protein